MKVKIENLYETHSAGVATLIVLFALVFTLALVFGIFCFQGWIFMLLWNWLAVALFGANPLGFWVCVGIVSALNFLGKLIFGRNSSAKD